MNTKPTFKEIVKGILIEYSENEGIASAQEWIPEMHYDQIVQDIADNSFIHFSQIVKSQSVSKYDEIVRRSHTPFTRKLAWTKAVDWVLNLLKDK